MAELPKQPNASPFISPRTAAGSWAAVTGVHSTVAYPPSSPHPPSSPSPLPLLHHQQLTVSLQTRQRQPGANSFLLPQFLCSSSDGREWPEGLPGTAARRKGEKHLSSGTKVELFFPGWEMELLGVGLPKSWCRLKGR